MASPRIPAGRVKTHFPPHRLQRSHWPALGTVIVSGSASTSTSPSRPQASHVAVTARTPVAVILAIDGETTMLVIIGPEMS
jgi:hypothetical protein